MSSGNSDVEAITDNPAVSIVVAGVKGFIEAEG
jgi:hypothetical protein